MNFLLEFILPHHLLLYTRRHTQKRIPGAAISPFRFGGGRKTTESLISTIQLGTTSISLPCDCTVHVYVLIHFVMIVCGICEWKLFCLLLQERIGQVYWWKKPDVPREIHRPYPIFFSPYYVHRLNFQRREDRNTYHEM